MALRVTIPNLKGLRKIAGALATPAGSAVEASPGESIAPDLAQSVQNYFLTFPWTGIPLKPRAGMPAIDTARVGEYFAAFNWDGNPVIFAETDVVTEKVTSFADSEDTEIDYSAPPKEKPSFENFFGDVFD